MKYRYYEKLKGEYLVHNMETLELELVDKKTLNEGIRLGLVKEYSLRGDFTRRIVTGIIKPEVFFETNYYRMYISNPEEQNEYEIIIEMKDISEDDYKEIPIYIFMHEISHKFLEVNRYYNTTISLIGKLDDFTELFARNNDLRYVTTHLLDTSDVMRCHNMFYGCNALIEANLVIKSNKGLDLQAIFKNCTGLSRVDLDIQGKVYNLTSMFQSCLCLSEVNFIHLDTEYILSFSSMFQDCQALNDLDLSKLNTKNAESFNSMFCRCNSFTKLDLSTFDTSNVKNMCKMFNSCTSLTELDLSNFDTRKVENFNSMFSQCIHLEKLNLSGFRGDKVIDLLDMFNSCFSLKRLDLSSFNTPNLKGVSSMFASCNKLEYLDISKFDTSHCIQLKWFFYECNKLKELKYDPEKFILNTVANERHIPEQVLKDLFGQHVTPKEEIILNGVKHTRKEFIGQQFHRRLD